MPVSTMNSHARRGQGAMNSKVTRFSRSERLFHNMVMITYALMLATGIFIIYCNFYSERGVYRDYCIIAHKASGVLFLSSVLAVVLFGDKKVWIENIRALVVFTLADIEWLLKKPLSVFVKSVKLPPADKFNPGQKVWIAIAFIGSVTLALTGVNLWINRLSIISLIAHTIMALVMIFPLLGHMYMAIINKDTRGVGVIINGKVDYAWAQRHHPLWVDRKKQDTKVSTRIKVKTR